MSVADDILKDLTDRIAKTIDSFKGDLQAIRTGRANLHVLDAVRIDYYGQMTPLAPGGHAGRGRRPAHHREALGEEPHPPASRRPSATPTWASTPSPTRTSSASPSPRSPRSGAGRS